MALFPLANAAAEQVIAYADYFAATRDARVAVWLAIFAVMGIPLAAVFDIAGSVLTALKSREALSKVRRRLT